MCRCVWHTVSIIISPALFQLLRGIFINALGTHFPRAPRKRVGLVVHSFMSSFLCMGMVTPVCQSCGTLLEHKAT